MSTPHSLPDAALLEKLLLGQLPPAEAEALCVQLQDSEQFAVLAQSLIASDTLIEALHAQTTHPTPKPDARLEGLMARLSKLRPDLSGVADDRTAAEGPAVGGVPITFLSPARQPDEMGRLGDYRVLKVLGQGGMGVVFLAEDMRLGRRVALKTMRPEAAQMANAKQRFLREARGTAAIEHDHIIPIFQVGEENGVPFLAMPLLRGEPLDERLKRADGKPLAVREIVRIGREVAEGLAAAHEQGLIHRDIKPANVWLEGERGRVKVLDFGLARAAGADTNLTQSGAIVGTPAYMAPEQARGEAIDPRCDLFSLGSLLYQMSTGQRPFNGPDTMSILMSLALDQPAPPRQRNAVLPQELSDLVTRLLAKKPEDRPASAHAVAAALTAIERGLSDVTLAQTVSIGPAVAVPKPARSRRRLAVAVAAALLLTGGLIAAVVIIRDKTGKEVARVTVPDGGSVEVKPDGKGKSPENDKKQAAAIPADPLPKIEPGTPLGPLALVTNPAPLPGVRSWTIETRTPRGGIIAVAYRPDGRLLATAGEDGVIRLREPSTGRPLRALVGHAAKIFHLAWSPDGRILASGDMYGTVRLWDADTGRHLRTLSGFPGGAFDWLPDGLTIAACWDRSVTAWNVVSGEIVRTTLLDGAHPFALSPDGKRAAGVWGDKIRICDSESGQEVRTLPALPGGVLCLSWSPDGRLLASTTGGDRTVRLWQLETGKELWSLKTPGYVYRQMAWSPDGKTLAVNRDPVSVDFIRVEGGKLLASRQIPFVGGGMAWSADSQHFAAGTLGGHLWLMKGATGIPVTIPAAPGNSFLTSLAWSPDGKQLAAATYGAGTRVVNPTTGEATASLTDAGHSIAWSPSKWLAAAGPDAVLTLWQPGGGKRVLPAHKRGYAFARAWSPDGKTLAEPGSDQNLRLWDGATGQAKATWNIGPPLPFPQTMTWSPDGKLLAVSIAEGPIGKVKVLHADTGKEQRSIPNFNSVAWSPVGDTLAVFNRPHANVQLLDAKTGEATVKLSTVDIQVVAWSPDGKLLATACSGAGGDRSPSLIQVWDAATGEEVRKLDRVCLLAVAGMAWSPDGKRIAAGGQQTIQLWDSATGKTDGVIFHYPHFHGLTIRPDGQYRGNFKVAEEVVMVVQKEDGGTETLTPAEFAKKYGWKQGDAPPESAPVKQPAVVIQADPLPKIEPGTPLGPLALVTNPAPLPGVRSWAIETRMPRGGILAVAYRPDGRMLATAGEDGVVRLLDSQSGQLIRALVGHVGRITLLAWSPDGRTLASGSWDGTVRLWDADSGRSLRTLTGLAQPHALAWSADGRSVMGCVNPDILTWDAVTGKTLHKVSLGKVVMQPAFSPDGKLLAGESDGHTVRIWEARTGREVRSLKGHTATVYKVGWSPDGKRLASTGDDAVRLWETATGKEVRTHSIKDNVTYNTLTWSPDGRTLVLNQAGGHTAHLDLMQVDSRDPLRTVPACNDAVGLSWTPDGKTLASGGLYGDVAVTDIESGGRTELHQGPAGSSLTNLAWSPDSKQLAATTYGAGTRVLNPTTGEATATLTDTGGVVAWSPSKWLAAAGPDGQITLWQPSGGRRVLPPHKSGGVRSFAWSPDGKTLADAGSEQDLRLWDGATRQAKGNWNVGPVVPGTPPAWSPDGKRLALCIQDGAAAKVKVLRTDTGEEQRVIPNYNAAAWSPIDDTLALFNGYFPNVQLLDAKTGEAGVKLTTGGQGGWSPGGVLAVAWSPDGKQLAIGCIGEAGSRCMSSIQVWNPATGERLRNFDRVCLYNITALAWSPDGKRIAACAYQTIQMWDAASGKSEGVISPNPQLHGLTIRPDGHYRGDAKVDEAIVVVVQKEDGSTETLPPAEFARKFKWKNEP